MNLEKELKSAKKGSSLVVITSPEKFTAVSGSALSYFTKKKKSKGVYISITQPVDKLISELKGSNIDFEKVLFLDGISRTLNKGLKDSDNCIYLQGPTSLTEIGIILTKTTYKTDVGFIIIDSLSSMLTYCPEITAVRFIQFLAAKVQRFDALGIVMVSKSDSDKSIINTIKGFSDKTIVI